MDKKVCILQLLPWKTENIECEIWLELQKAFKDNILPHKLFQKNCSLNNIIEVVVTTWADLTNISRIQKYLWVSWIDVHFIW